MATKVVRIGAVIIKSDGNDWILKYRAELSGPGTQRLESVQRFKTRREAIEAAFYTK